MHLAIGIDVGFSAYRRSTGVAILDRATRDVAAGSELLVDTAERALAFVRAEIARLRPTRITACVDGSFEGALPGTSTRLVERLFMSGPFSTSGGLRLCPAGTPASSRFLASTRALLAGLREVGLTPLTLSGTRVSGNVAEIFPTLFMASLLEPHRYVGKRSAHTDDLWLRLVGPGGHAPVPALAPYAALASRVESARRSDLHDLRTAAISAIAAHWSAVGPPGSSPAALTYIGHATELGFVLPPPALLHPAFLAMLETHWDERAPALPGLRWIR